MQTQNDETQVETSKTNRQWGKTRQNAGIVINKIRQKHKTERQKLIRNQTEA